MTGPRRRKSKTELKQESRDRAYARGECTNCYRPHKNVVKQPDGSYRQAQVCANCQGDRSAAQKARRARKRLEASS